MIMKRYLAAFTGAFHSEITILRHSPLLLFFTVIQAITFIFLVHFFGMTGAFAPTAVINNDKGYYSEAFIQSLQNAHHSFAIQQMDSETAKKAVTQGKLVSVITIPEGFSEALDAGETTPLEVVVDNIDTDMTADIQRAMPSAIAAFGNQYKIPGIRVHTNEIDLIDHDTGFIPYLVVSALALSAFIISGILGAITVAREFESKTAKLLIVSPVPSFIPFLGRVMATNTVSLAAMMIAVGIVIFGHGVVPLHRFELLMILLISVTVFGLIGAALGAVMKKTLPVASLVFGISLPFYLFSGTYEPERFDGNIIWGLAHLTPLYYAVGILEHAVLGLRVTPEPLWLLFVALFGWACLAFGVMWFLIRRNVS